MSDVRVIHFRCREGGKVLTKGGVTVAVRTTETRQEAAYAICSAADGFNPIEGRKRALARLNSKPKNGRRNSRLFGAIVSSMPLADKGDERALRRLGFQKEMEMLAKKPDDTVVFAWDVAAFGVMRMKGGKPEDIQRLQTTLAAYPREKVPA